LPLLDPSSAGDFVIRRKIAGSVCGNPGWQAGLF